jgi:hypothetical protein
MDTGHAMFIVLLPAWHFVLRCASLLCCCLHGTLCWDVPVYCVAACMALCVEMCQFILRTVTAATCIQLLELKVKLPICLPWRYTGRLEVQFGAGCRWMVNFTPKERKPTFRRRLGWPQSWSGHFGEENSVLLLLGVEPQTVQSSHCHDYTTLVLFQWQVTDRYWQQGLQDAMKRKCPLCVDVGSKSLCYLYVASNGQNCIFLILYGTIHSKSLHKSSIAKYIP